MTKHDLWQRYLARNPKFLTEGAHFTAEGLKKFFDQTYDVAHAEGMDEAMDKFHSASSASLPEGFETLFGMGIRP